MRQSVTLAAVGILTHPPPHTSKHLWIFTKLGMCIDIVEIWFVIANGQIFSNFYRVICQRHSHILLVRRIT